jgi:hypothetical protein
VQNQNVTMTGNSVAVKATCPVEAIEFTCGTATFTFQYATRADETSNPNQVGQPLGDAGAAEQVSATDFRFVAETARFKPWAVGDVIGFLNGANGGVIAARPRRPGGS